MQKNKFECKEHNRKFKGGQGLAAHVRRWHSGAAPAAEVQTPPTPAFSPRHHLDAALTSIDTQIETVERFLATLQKQREHVVAAQDADNARA